MSLAPKGDIHNGLIINGKFLITSKIGEGAFGEIFEAKTLPDTDASAPVAIKFESSGNKKSSLLNECRVLSIFKCLHHSRCLSFAFVSSYATFCQNISLWEVWKI